MIDFFIEQFQIIIPIIGMLIMAVIIIVVPFSDYFKKRKLEKSFKEAALETEQKWRENKEKNEIRKKREAESLSLLEKKYSDFADTHDYRFIEHFARKFYNKTNELEFVKLQTLLKTHRWDFSLYELKLLVDKETKKQDLERFKTKYLKNRGEPPQEIIKVFLSNFSMEDSKMLGVLAEILKEKGLVFNNPEHLKKELAWAKAQIEAQEYAKFLLNDSLTPD